MPSTPISFKPLLSTGIAVITLALISPLHADYFKNGDLKEGIAGWHGDGERVFLKADGTEGADGDADVIPVIKLKLSSGQPREVSQEINLHDSPTTLHVKIEIFASADFKRSAFPQDYTKTWKTGTYYWSNIIIPSCDFWIRGGPGWFYKLAQATPGSWSTVEGSFDNLESVQTRVISFCVPPGSGTLYLKNATAVP